MTTELPHTPTPQTIDLTGLPAPVVESIKQLVESLREGMPREEQKPPSRRPPLRGRFSDLQLSIPKEHIDEARREAWASFPREFPEPGKS